MSDVDTEINDKTSLFTLSLIGLLCLILFLKNIFFYIQPNLNKLKKNQLI